MVRRVTRVILLNGAMSHGMYYFEVQTNAYLGYVREKLARVQVRHEVRLGADERIEVGGLVVRPDHESDDAPYSHDAVVALPAGALLERPHLG